MSHTPAHPLDDYPHRAAFPTRWNDNDVYGHVNNTVHYLAMDTVINTWLIEHAGLVIDPEGADPIAVCVESGCHYRASITYPDTIEVGLRIDRLGTSSVTWALAMTRGDGTMIAQGRFVHVFVDRGTRRPTDIPLVTRIALGALQ